MIHTEAMERLQEFQGVQEMPTTPIQPSGPTRWSPPPNSWCKANFDGAVFQELGAAGLGVEAIAGRRDHEGNVIELCPKELLYLLLLRMLKLLQVEGQFLLLQKLISKR